MWKYVSRRIKDTFERGAGYFDARSAATAGSGVQRDKAEHPSAVPSRWLCERRCWNGKTRKDGAHHNSYFNYLNQTWLGAITWSGALCLGWYASQLIHLKHKYHNHSPGPLCQIASQLQKNLSASRLLCGKLRAISEDGTEQTKEREGTRGYIPVQLINNDSGSATSSSSGSSERNELSDILNSIENRLGLAAIDNGQHQDGLGMLRSAANRHHPPALYNLALCYELGLGVKSDEKMAMELYQTAASMEHPGALYNLAVYYGQGRGGLPRDPDTAIRLLRIAAYKGHTDAIDALKTFEPEERTWSHDIPTHTNPFVEHAQDNVNNFKCHAAVF